MDRRRPHHGVRADFTARRRARHRDHGGVHRLRQHQHLSRFPRALHQSEHDARESYGPRPGARRRCLLGLFRPLSRPAAGVRVHGQPLRRADRRDTELARWRRRFWWRRWRRWRAARILRSAAGRCVVGRAVHERRPTGFGRIHGGDGHSVQEPALPAARRQHAAPLGFADRPAHPRQERDGRLVAGLPRGGRVSAADGRARRHDRPVDQPQHRDPADLHRGAVRQARRRRPVRERPPRSPRAA